MPQLSSSRLIFSAIACLRRVNEALARVLFPLTVKFESNATAYTKYFDPENSYIKMSRL